MPLVLHYNPAKFQVLSIKTNGTIDEAAFKLDIATLWKKYYPGEQASISNYEKDLYDRYFPGRDMKFMGVFCVVVFVIAIMGLLGIVTYHTEKRVKEIGIRKVMGASVPAIVKVLSTSFIKLIFISAAIALPVGYMLCYVFLSVFTFNNGINFLLLTVLFCVLFAIALVTIGYKAIYAANANPVKSLRTE
jgi:putative ABC transport system permease protein